jgi:hypothetical protein
MGDFTEVKSDRDEVSEKVRKSEQELEVVFKSFQDALLSQKIGLLGNLE